MDPLYLQALMNGQVPFKNHETNNRSKSEVESKLNLEIEACVDAMENDEDPNVMRLLTPEMKKAKRKLEIKEALTFPELSKQIDLAITLIITEGENHLDNKEKQSLLESLVRGLENASKVDSKIVADVNIQEIMKIENDSLQSIVKIANALYLNGQYMDCYALYFLLTFLKPEISEFWFRCGIAAQSAKNYVLAYQAYAAASEIDPNHLATRLLNAECHIRCNNFDRALAEFEASKLISEFGELDPELIELQASIKAILSKAKN